MYIFIICKPIRKFYWIKLGNYNYYDLNCNWCVSTSTLYILRILLLVLSLLFFYYYYNYYFYNHYLYYYYFYYFFYYHSYYYCSFNTTADSRNATLTTISTCFDYAFAKPTTFATRFATFISTFDDWSDNACRLKHNQVGKFE